MTIHVAEEFLLRPATMADAPTVADLMNTCSQAAIGADETKPEEVRNNWQFPGFEPERDTRIMYAPDGQVVGFASLWNRTEPFVKNWVHIRIHPDYEHRADLVLELLSWGEEAARQRLPKAPAGAKVTLSTGCLDKQTKLAGHFKAYGMRLNRHFLLMKIDMDAAPPEPVLPEGIHLTTMAVLDDLPGLIRAVDDAFQDHWGYVSHAYEDDLADWQSWIKALKERGDYDPSLWFLVMDGEEIVGMSLCMPRMTEDPQMAYLDTLGVRRPWRRRGIGLALMHHTFREFYRRGTRKVALHVDAQSLTGATRLYEKAGMYKARQYDDYELVLRDGVDLSTQTAAG